MKKRYIGTKIVQAEPAWRLGDGSVVSKDLMLPTGTAAVDGYKVVYQPDGYESWSPKEIFEQAYRRTDDMSFGLALEAAKRGERIARKGWNGKNQYVVLGHDFQYDTYDSDVGVAFHEDIGGKALVFVGTRGSQVGWLASQADMLADDWYIVE